MPVPRTEVPRAQRNGEGKLFETVFVERIVSSSLGPTRLSCLVPIWWAAAKE